MRYIIGRELYSDYAGVRYLAEDVKENKPVLIWALPVVAFENREKPELLSDLCKKLGELEGSYIPGVYGFYVETNAGYIITEYFEACTPEQKTAYHGYLNAHTEVLLKSLSATCRETVESAERQQALYGSAIEKLETIVAEQEDKLASAMDQAKAALAARSQVQQQSDTLRHALEELEARFSVALGQAAEKIASLDSRRQEALELASRQQEAIEQLKVQADQQGRKYESQLGQARQGFEAQDRVIKRIDRDGAKPISRAGAFKIALAVLSGVLFGTAAGYFYLRTENKGSYPPQKQEFSKLAQGPASPAVGISTEQLANAAEAGDYTAMFELGLQYYSGENVEKDYSKAFSLFHKAALAGNEQAMYNAGRMYHDGAGVKADYAKAMEWYEKAAQAGVTRAMNQLGQIYILGDIAGKDFKKAAGYYERSAAAGDIKGIYNLATLYRNGVGVEKDAGKAAEWFIKAAENGDAVSMYQLGLMCQSGDGVEKNPEEAIRWYRAATQAGHEDAGKKLLELVRSGEAKNLKASE